MNYKLHHPCFDPFFDLQSLLKPPRTTICRNCLINISPFHIQNQLIFKIRNIFPHTRILILSIKRMYTREFKQRFAN